MRGLIFIISYCALFISCTFSAPTTTAFRNQLELDLRHSVERLHTLAEKERVKNIKPSDFYYPYILSGIINLHRNTNEAVLLDWAKEDLMWITHCSIDSRGKVTPFFDGFRFLASYCDAYLYLKSHNKLSLKESSEVDDQIIASANGHLNRADFGAQNRGLIYGAELLFCANAVPHAPLVERWKMQGEALITDSVHGWDVEDASIYEPFWLNYVLTLAEMKGQLDDQMKVIMTRYYFDHAKALQMPNGLLPDWGDGDWIWSWMWNVANLVLAGSHYHDGTYLDSARRLYEASHAYYKELPSEAVGALGIALHWLNTSVPLNPVKETKSNEVVDDLISKKIVFRGNNSTYVLLNYRDAGPFGNLTREYQHAALEAYEEKPHHGHADENAIGLFAQDGTILLDDGGYRSSRLHGWRSDISHNRLVARTGFPLDGDIFDYIKSDTTYHDVTTEKVHFGTFGSLDYSRTRLVDEERGYTSDRITLFAPENGMMIIVDSVVIDRAGNKVFCNTWYPEHILKKGDNWTLSHPDYIQIRTESWPNPHTRDLLTQFIGNRDKIANSRLVDRRYATSETFYQYLRNYFFKGQRLLFVTVLRPVPINSSPEKLLSDASLITDEHDDNRSIGIHFTLNNEPVTVGLKLDQTIGLTNLRGRPMFDVKTGSITYDSLISDADFSFVREHKDGSIEFGFQYASLLRFKGSTLFKQPVWKEMYQGAPGFSVVDRRDKMPIWHEVVGNKTR